MSLRLKTILGVALIEAILLAILLTLTLNYLRTTNFDGLDQRATSTSNLFASTVKNAVLSYDLATVESFTKDLIKNEDITYVAVLGQGEQLLSGEGAIPDTFHKSHLEANSSQVSDGIFDISSPIEESGIEFGSVWLGFDMTALNTTLNDAKKWSTLIVVGEMTLVAMFSYLLGAYLTQRLSELKHAADQIAAGNRTIDISTQGRDELATVSRAFSNMVSEIKASEDQIKRYQNELEEANIALESRVEKRTAALLQANKQLTVTNDRLKSAKDKLVESEKMASIGTMAAGVAHEINNPMGSVSSNLQMCQHYLNTYQTWIEHSEAIINGVPSEDEEKFVKWKQEQYVDCLEEDFRDSLTDAMTSVDRVRNIVSALQSYATQLNKDQGSKERICLRDMLDDCQKGLENSDHINIALKPSLSELPPLHIFKDDFHQLFTELLKNGVQSCNRAKEQTTGHISIGCLHDKNKLVIQVVDNGVGVPSENLTRIYDPFFTTLPVGEGMGLGLTFAYNIARHHHGSIRLQNLDAGGAVVTLAFPASILAKEVIETADNA
ncbi:ATP-binding protein [Vibrio ostreicida]|uniref:histidine kinase n=1 Tax=Vibrio ostreicida TaxID=526588 RepID=A0ABT8BS29_9VIBR|nr:ATP-binding protein [Vibrio ostreicida]MDN3609941.1 ATP-binding protein [Vibrio ostreicida]NPD10370.1 HAMP domain-containing protein [Vibrio ostreicida]